MLQHGLLDQRTRFLSGTINGGGHEREWELAAVGQDEGVVSVQMERKDLEQDADKPGRGAIGSDVDGLPSVAQSACIAAVQRGCQR